MKGTLLASYSSCGKIYPQKQLSSSQMRSFVLKQNFSHEQPFLQCSFDRAANKIYLLDAAGALIVVSLQDGSFSTLKKHKINAFTVDGANSFNLLIVNKQEELYRISLESKQATKIMNLNIGKILAFERNYLRNMLLVLDYKLLLLCDFSDHSRITSIKANHRETFTNACFGSQNRFLVLAVKSIEIRIIEILKMKTIQSVTLPHEIRNLKLEVSYDCKTIAVYGDCEDVFLIRLEEAKVSYRTLQLPLTAVKQLKFSYQNEILILGSDQTIYVICPNTTHQMTPIFNSEEHIRLTAFDLSLDNKQLAIVSNRTIFTLNFHHGLKHHIQHSQEEKKSIIEKDNYQYVDEDEEDDEEPLIPFSTNKLINIPEIKSTLIEPIHKEIQDMPIPHGFKCRIQQIYKYLYETVKPNDLFDLYKQEVVILINLILKLARGDPYPTTEICFYLLEQLAVNVESIHTLAALVAPNTFLKVQSKHNFNDFFLKNSLSLFSALLSPTKVAEVVNSILRNSPNGLFITVFFLLVLREFEEGEQDVSAEHKIDVRKIEKETLSLLEGKQLQVHLAQQRGSGKAIEDLLKVSEFPDRTRSDTLQELIARQAELKKALTDVRR